MGDHSQYVRDAIEAAEAPETKRVVDRLRSESVEAVKGAMRDLCRAHPMSNPKRSMARICTDLVGYHVQLPVYVISYRGILWAMASSCMHASIMHA
jgi:hypothetical protein